MSAPEWARWSAVNKDGYLFYYDSEPVDFGDVWACFGKQVMVAVGHNKETWKESKRKLNEDKLLWI